MSVKTIEEEKTQILQFVDFNVNDAYKVLIQHKREQGRQILASKVDLSDLELNTALLSLPGQIVSGDPIGCNLFCRKYASNRLTQRINYQDFIGAFLPVNLDLAKMLLQRPEKYGKNKSTIKDIRAVFSPRTFS